jgi:hypothetical protein
MGRVLKLRIEDIDEPAALLDVQLAVDLEPVEHKLDRYAVRVIVHHIDVRPRLVQYLEASCG